jgi:hypothetical protein
MTTTISAAFAVPSVSSIRIGDHIQIKRTPMFDNAPYQEVEVIGVQNSKTSPFLLVKNRNGAVMRIHNAAQKIIKKIFPSFGNTERPIFIPYTATNDSSDNLEERVEAILKGWGIH